MMQFFFARNMFMYYHALHVIFFFFLVPYVSIVTLSLSSSLSLSLSLSLSFSLLIMAPKKFVPSKNPIRRGSSSFSFPLDSVQFHDEKARSDFFENFFDQAIHSER